LKGPIVFSAVVYLSKSGNEGDLDNYAKTLKDALNGIAWEDDRRWSSPIVTRFMCRVLMISELLSKLRRREEATDDEQKSRRI